MSGFGSFIAMALSVAGSLVSGGTSVALYFAAMAVSAIDGAATARREQRRARDEYNSSLKDRLQMADVEADAARTMALGRVRAVEGIRRRWISGTYSERLTLVVSFAGHEIDGFEQFYLDDEPVTLDANGWANTDRWGPLLTGIESLTATRASGAVTTVVIPVDSPKTGAYMKAWAREDKIDINLPVSIVGSNAHITCSGTSSLTIRFEYTYERRAQHLRIRPYLGTSAQNVGADLAAEYPGQLTSTDRFAGIALAVVDLIYSPDVFPTGIPNITAVFRGAKVYDPRKDSTVSGGSGAHRLGAPGTWEFSENPALHAYHFLRASTGWAVPAAEIRTADVMAAADACDVPTVFTLRKADNSTTTTGSIPRHRCGIVIKSDAGRRDSLDEIMKTMAGRWGWAGGTFRFRAAAMAAPVFDLQPSWVAHRLSETGQADDSPVVKVTNGLSRENRVTRITGSCIDPEQRFQAMPFPAVQDSALIALAQGIPMPLELRFEGVNSIAHAQHLGSIFIRQGQAALRAELQCNLSAWRCELLDVGTVTLPRLGMAAKTFEVIGWRWHPTEGVSLKLQEIEAALFSPMAELVGRDPAPNSNLPAPWDVQAVAGLAVTSGTAALVDGSILTRTQVTWTPVTQASVTAGGQVEVQYALSNGDTLDWMSWAEQGSSSKAVIPGLLAGERYLFRVRAVQGMPQVRGTWSDVVDHVVSDAPAVTTVKDTSGNTILGPGTTLPLEYTDPAAKNTSITVDAQTGQLAGIGTAGVVVNNDLAQIGGANLLGMSAFERWGSPDPRPMGWIPYHDGAGVTVNLTQSSGAAGLFGTHYVRVTAAQAPASYFGIFAGSNIDALAASGVQTWVAGATYVASFWARAMDSTMAGRFLFVGVRNFGFQSITQIECPALTSTWQRYSYRVVVGATSTGDNGELFITWDRGGGALPAGANFDLCAPKVEAGRVPTAWTACERDNRNTLLTPSIEAAQATANSAATSLAGKLNKAGDTITGRINLAVADGIFVGADTDNGVYMGSGGLVGKKAGATTFAVDTAGNATFGGDVTAARVVYTGSMQSASYVAGVSGWTANGDGSAEFGILSVRGKTNTYTLASTAFPAANSGYQSFLASPLYPDTGVPSIAYRLEIAVYAQAFAYGAPGSSGSIGLQVYDLTSGVAVAESLINTSLGPTGGSNTLSGIYYVDVPAGQQRTLQLRATSSNGSTALVVAAGAFMKISVRGASF